MGKIVYRLTQDGEVSMYETLGVCEVGDQGP